MNDALHEGLERNPLFEGVSDGYRFKNEKHDYTRMASAGYADDAIVASETEDGIIIACTNGRSFFRAHRWKINVDN